MAKKVKAPLAHECETIKVKFMRFDQPENILKARLRTREIDWKGQIKSGFVYDLPKPVVAWLNGLHTPQFQAKENPDGTMETVQVGSIHRFACVPV